MARKLTQKEKSYIYWRARGYTQDACMYKAGYKVKNRNVASALASKMENKVKIGEAIELEKVSIFDKNSITDEFVLGALRKIATNGKQEANKVRSLELLGKYLQMFKETSINIHNANVISQEERNILSRYGVTTCDNNTPSC